MNTEKYINLVDYTLGRKKSDLVLKNGSIIMVQSGEIIKSDVAIQDGYIVGVGEYEGKQEIDCTGKYISPGFIDSHLHFESTMARPSELVYYASMSGTTTYIADPHEAGNVSGNDGIRYILESTENSTGDVYIMMPSCVPAVDGEDSGYVIEAEDMVEILIHPRILGLGEVMDTKAVLDCKESMMKKFELFKDKPIDGHGLGLRGENLSAYAMAGVLTDHECSFYEEAINEIRNGMYVHIREGSAARNLKNIVEGIVKNNTDISRFTFCTDDKHIEDIKKEGHISHNIRKAISLGINTVDAYKMATLNPATCYKLDNVGMISPGKKANLVVLSDLEEVSVESVFHNGKLIVEISEEDREKDDFIISEKLLNTVNMDDFGIKNLELKSKDNGIGLIPGELLTKRVIIDEKTYDDLGKPNKVAVIERHHRTGKYHTCQLFGYGIKNGAVASSVSHDSHNIIIVGDNDEDMMIALEKLKDIQGGYVLVENGKVFDYLPLSIMGLMSQLSSEKIEEKLHGMIKKCVDMGVDKGIDPFITLSFIALPVIPKIRITTNGLYDVVNNEYLY